MHTFLELTPEEQPQCIPAMAFTSSDIAQRNDSTNLQAGAPVYLRLIPETYQPFMPVSAIDSEKTSQPKSAMTADGNNANMPPTKTKKQIKRKPAKGTSSHDHLAVLERPLHLANTYLQSPSPTLPDTPTTSILLTTFLRYLSHSARASSWTFSLSRLSASTSPATLTLRASLQAVTLAHFANTTSDPVFSHHARLEYGRSLSLHRHSLARLPTLPLSQASAKPALLETVRYAVLASVILAYYELIAAVTPTAWLTHTLACEQLLCLIGPDLVGQDVTLRQIAVSVRSHAVVRVVLYGQPTSFTTPAWRTAVKKWTKAQRQSISRDAYDWVVDYMLRLCLYARRQPAHERLDPRLAGEPQSENVVNSPELFLADLQRAYDEWLSSCSPSSLPLFPPPPLPIQSQPDLGLPHPLRQQFPSMALAYFHAAAILLVSHFPHLSPTNTNTIPDDTAAWNARWIMSAGRFLEQSIRTNATAVLRMAVPFAVVWMCCDRSGRGGGFGGSSSDDEGKEQQEEEESLRHRSRAMFDEWARKEGMAGLVVVSFPSSLSS